MSDRRCSFSGCQKKHCARGLCNAHWQQQNLGKPLTPLRMPVQGCDYPGCTSKHYGKRLCSRHFERIHKNNLTLEAYLGLLEKQDYRCAICRSDTPGGKGSWHVDHDHSCCPGLVRDACGGCIRGLLCHSCNTGLGHFREELATLLRAVSYLGGEDASIGVAVADL